MASVKATKANFEELISTSDKPVLVDFWAQWCGPCRMVAPVVEEIAKERPDLLVLKVNVDEEEDIARKFNIRSIPTLLAFEGGKIVNQSVGFSSKENILRMFK